MKDLRHLVFASLFIVCLVIGTSAQTHREANSSTDRQVSVILQRLERDSSQYRRSLNSSLVQSQIDQTKSENDISSFETSFETATHQFRSTFGRRLAGASYVESVLRPATLVNSFMSRNRLNRQVQNDWVAVRADLNGLASAYGLNWDWNRKESKTTNSSGSLQLSDSDIGKLIQRLETGGDTFRTSLTEAFALSPYDRTFNEAQINDAVRGLKKDTDQLRIQFDDRQPIISNVERVLARATVINTYLSSYLQTNRLESDWGAVRTDMNKLASAFNLSVNWESVAATLTEYDSDSRLVGRTTGSR